MNIKILFCCLLSVFFYLPLSATKIDSLFHVFENQQGRGRVEAANTLQREIFDAGFIDNLFEISYNDSEKNIDAYIHCIMGTVALLTGDNFKGIKYYEKGIALFEDIGDSINHTRYQLNLHFCYKMAGDYLKALDCLQKCLSVYTDRNDELWMARVFFSMGQLYSENDKDSIAVVYLNKALDLQRKLGVANDYQTTLATLSDAYLKLENIELAEKCAKEAYDIVVTLNDIMGQESAMQTLGQVYRAKSEYDKSLDYLMRAVNLNEENNGRTDYKAYTCYLIAETFSASGKNPDEAEEYFMQSLTLSENAENAYYQQLAYTGLVNLNLSRNPQKALEFMLKQIEIKETLFNDQTKQQLNDFQVKYDTQQKEIEITRQQAVISRYKSNRIIFIVSLSLTVMILILLWRMLALRNKSNLVLAEMNATKDKFFSIISHDLKNPAIAQRDALQQLISHSKEWNTELLSQFYSELLKSAEGQVELLYNLLNWARVQAGRMPYNPIRFDLPAALRPDITLIENMAKRKGVITNIRIPETAIVTGDSNMIATVARNLLTNAVKFTPAENIVSLHIERAANGGFTVCITDTGTGMSDAQLRDLYNLDSLRARQGTNGESGSGLGLVVCRELIEKNGSTLNVESEEGKGSCFWFTLIE